MLHTLMKSPFETNISLGIRLLKSSDDFLALQDGVIIALKDNLFLDDITFITTTPYVIQEDVYARGLCNKISNKFVLISYTQFVLLTIKHKQQIIW